MHSLRDMGGSAALLWLGVRRLSVSVQDAVLPRKPRLSPVFSALPGGLDALF